MSMRQRLHLPAGLDGQLWHYRHQGRNAMHRHEELELNLVTAGSGLYLLENRKYEIRRGDLLWLFPSQEHLLVDASADFEMWIGVFKPAMVRRCATDADAKHLREKNPAENFCRRLAQPELLRLEKMFLELSSHAGQTGFFNAGLGFALLSAWQWFAHAADVPVRDVHPAVEKAARIIRHENNELGLDELARRAGLSAARLSRLFKQQTGVALVDFRNRQRVEKFQEIYGTGQRRTMLDAALEAGFGSYAQFHRIFKRVTGRSPGEQRRK
jgi:AraC-like DNA-binding protein/quercetin dioxygenase-like cupin family protein